MTASAAPWWFDTFRADAAEFQSAGVGRRNAQNDSREEHCSAPADLVDLLLLEQLARGDAHALETVFDRYLAPLVRFADTTLGLHSGAAGPAGDIVSDVLVALWARREMLVSVRNLRAYLYRAVRNRALNYRRAERRGERRSETLADAGEIAGSGVSSMRPDEMLEADECLQLVWRTVHAMREPLRTIAILRWSNGMSFAEIASVIDASEGTVRAQASRALAILRETIPKLLR